MTAIDRERSFILEDLRVLAVQAKSLEISDEPHIDWFATFYEADPVFEDEDSTRVLIATLHAGSNDGWGTVTVGGLVTPTDPHLDVEIDKLSSLIAESAALETLYDFARVNLRTVSGMADIHLSLPFKSPNPTINFAGSDDEIPADL